MPAQVVTALEGLRACPTGKWAALAICKSPHRQRGGEPEESGAYR